VSTGREQESEVPFEIKQSIERICEGGTMTYAKLLSGAALIALALGVGIPSQTTAQTTLLAQAVTPDKPDMSKTRTGKFRGGGGARRGGGGMGRAAVA
jgi:hypothetical protein